MRHKWLVFVLMTVALTTFAMAQGKKVVPEKGGADETGPYDVVPNWPIPLHDDGYIWGSTPGVWAETPDRVWVFQRGEVQPKLPKLVSLEGQVPYTASGVAVPAIGYGFGDRPRRWEHVLMIFDRGGKLVESWENNNKYFTNAHRVQVNPYDPEKHIWLSDHTGNQILEFTHDGKKLLRALGEKDKKGADQNHFNGPTDVAFLPSGEFFVVDGYNNTRVVKFSKEGKYLLEWGKPGQGPGEFKLPHSIAIDAKRRLYIADRSNSRVQVFDENGKFLDMWPNMRSPYYLYMSKDQHLWVGDGDLHKILKYDLDGHLLYSWGTYGAFPGGLWGIHQFSVDTENNLYVADVFNYRVQKFRPKPGADPAKLVGQPFP